MKYIPGEDLTAAKTAPQNHAARQHDSELAEQGGPGPISFALLSGTLKCWIRQDGGQGSNLPAPLLSARPILELRHSKDRKLTTLLCSV